MIKSEARYKTVVFGMLFYTATILLVLQFILLAGSSWPPFAYLASIGYFILIGSRPIIFIRREIPALCYDLHHSLWRSPYCYDLSAKQGLEEWWTLWTDGLKNTRDNRSCSHRQQGQLFLSRKPDAEALKDYLLAASKTKWLMWFWRDRPDIWEGDE